MKRVLLYGYEREHLKQRELALQEAGLDAELVSTRRHAIQRARAGAFDAAVLGHSLRQRDREDLVGILKSINQSTCVILLYRGSISGAEIADAVLSHDALPADLVETVLHVLAQTEARKAAKRGIIDQIRGPWLLH